jgi:hypothetical protein
MEEMNFRVPVTGPENTGLIASGEASKIKNSSETKKRENYTVTGNE